MRVTHRKIPNVNFFILKTCTIFYIILLLIITADASGFGRCPKYPSMPKFNLNQILGKWYEVERSFYLPEIVSGCTTLQFNAVNMEDTAKSNTTKLEVEIETINRLTGNLSVNRGFATPQNRKSSIMDFKIKVKSMNERTIKRRNDRIDVQIYSRTFSFKYRHGGWHRKIFNTRIPDVIARLLPGSGKYQILYTDYENYIIMWSCGSLASLGYADQIWIFGRKRDFLVDIRAKIYDTLKQLSLDPNRLVLSKNKNCPKL